MTETCTTCGFEKPCLPTCPENTANLLVAAVPPKKEKPKSRPDRWRDAVADAEIAVGDLRSALETLDSIREEYEEWQGNLPENLENSPLGEKLQTVVDLGVQDALSSVDEIESVIGEAYGADLPLGFGRD